MSDGEIRSISVFTDNEVALAVVVDLRRVGEVLFRSTAIDLKLPLLGKLERSLNVIASIEHLHKLRSRKLGS